MIEHEMLLKYAKDEDDYPVMFYLAKKGQEVDWKETLPEEVLYVPEEMFLVVAEKFIKKIGAEGYYGKIMLNNELIELLCEIDDFEEPSKRRKEYLYEFQRLISRAEETKHSNYLAFEGP